MNDDWQDALPPYARDVIASAEHDECNDATFERMNKKVLAAAVGAAALGTASAASAAGAKVGAGAAGTLAANAGVGALSSVLVKVLGAVIVGTSMVGGAVWVASDSDETEAVQTSAPTGEAPSMEEAELDDVEQARDPRLTPEPALLEEEPPANDGLANDELANDELANDGDGRTVNTTRRPAAPELHSLDPNPSLEDPSADESLGDELRLLQDLRRRISTSPARALRLADEHASRFADSDLAAERELYRVRALLQLDRRDEARDVATRFRVTFPGSPYSPRIDALLEAVEP